VSEYGCLNTYLKYQALLWNLSYKFYLHTILYLAKSMFVGVSVCFQVLCLANGERIGLTPSMRLMFEVDDLSQASPATISRCAMVYMVSRRNY
jgi:hypothetical protein